MYLKIPFTIRERWSLESNFKTVLNIFLTLSPICYVNVEHPIRRWKEFQLFVHHLKRVCKYIIDLLRNEIHSNYEVRLIYLLERKTHLNRVCFVSKFYSLWNVCCEVFTCHLVNFPKTFASLLRLSSCFKKLTKRTKPFKFIFALTW
jgi:hypothetical protein